MQIRIDNLSEKSYLWISKMLEASKRHNWHITLNTTKTSFFFAQSYLEDSNQNEIFLLTNSPQRNLHVSNLPIFFSNLLFFWLEVICWSEVVSFWKCVWPFSLVQVQIQKILWHWRWHQTVWQKEAAAAIRQLHLICLHRYL